MGKKSPAPPPAPDYAGAAIQQGQANLEAARLTARLSNPNISTPLGGQRVTFGRESFNQSAYDKAMADYNKQLEAYNAAKASGQPFQPTPGQPPGGLPTSPFATGPKFGGEDLMYGPNAGLEEYVSPLSGGAGFGGMTYDPNTGAPVAPTREQFTTRTDLDTPFIEQYLTPEAQQTLEAQQRVERALSGLGEQAIGKVSDIYKDTFRPQGLPEQQFRFDYGQLPTAPDLAGMGQFQRGFRAEEMPTTPDITAMGQAGANVQAQGVNYGPAAGFYGLAGGGPAAPTQIAGADLSMAGRVAGGPQAGQFGMATGFAPAERLAQSIDVSGLAQLPVGAGTTAQQAILSRVSPQLQRDRAALENQLRNQGLVPGGEAYNREIELFNQRANDLVQQAALQGINVDAAMRAQGFSERQIQTELANQARQAQFGMGTTQAQLANQAVGQNFQQALAAQQAQNQAQAQAFQQQLQTGQFGREAQQMAFQMGQSAQQMYNQAVQQNMAMGLSAAEAQNRAAQQAFQQQGTVQELRNQALAQNQAAAMQQYQAQLGRQAQGFGQQMDLAGLYNASLAAQQQSALQQAQAAAALQAQGYNQAQGAAAFQNAQRQAALQEQLALRSQPLNEIAAIMGGAQVQMPQFQAYQGADVAAAPIFGATQAAGNFAQQNYQNQMAGYNAQMGLLGNVAGMAGTALGGPLGGAIGKGLFGGATPSDRRLKSNVVRVGTHPLGIGIYEYDIFGERQRGVMADEVEAVKPEAVTTHPTEGYKMVYYGMLT